MYCIKVFFGFITHDFITNVFLTSYFFQTIYYKQQRNYPKSKWRKKMKWNIGDIHDAIADVLPGDAAATIHDGEVGTWSEFTKKSNNLARFLLENGLNFGDKVAFYMRNSAAYSETLSACFKARLVHVNINYRYVDEELKYVIGNSDAAAVFYHAEFSEYVASIRDRLPEVKLWIEISDGDLKLDNVHDYENIVGTIVDDSFVVVNVIQFQIAIGNFNPQFNLG